MLVFLNAFIFGNAVASLRPEKNERKAWRNSIFPASKQVEAAEARKSL